MKYLIAGFGSIGRRHFRNLKTLGEKDFIFYRSQLGNLPDEEIAEYPVEIKIDDALQHNPDVVIVSNPTALHLDVAIPAAKQGCHLFIEKPISHSMDRIEDLRDIAERKENKILIGFQFRFHPQLMQIKQLLLEQVIGKLISVRVEWGEFLPGWHPWEDYRKGYSARKDLGGGVVLTLSHPFDYLNWLIGEINMLWAFTDKVSSLEIDVDAVAEIGLRFDNGVIGSIHLDFIQQPNTHTLNIVGSKGKIDWDYHKGSLFVYKASRQKPESYPLPPGFNRNWMFQDQMRHLVDLIKSDGISRCTLNEGILVQKLIHGINESANKGILFRL